MFGGRPEVVGSTIQFDGAPVEVIGVLADHPLLRVFSTASGDPVDFWTPGGAWSNVRRRARTQSALARLATGVTLEQAQAEMNVINDRLVAAYPDDNTGWTVRLTPLRDAVVSGVRTQLWFLFATSLCVVLIAALNVARLIATFNQGRQREFLTRIAVGASRAALARQAIVESLFISGVGGLAGVWLAYALLPSIIAAAPAGLPRFGEIGINQMAILFAAALAIGIGLVCGLVSQPRRRTTRPAWWPASVLVLQVAVALALTVATSLLVRSMQHVNAQALGFVPQNVVTATLRLPQGARFDIAEAHRRTDELLDRLRAHPQVVAAATGDRPLVGGGGFTTVRRPDAEGGDVRIKLGAVSPDYFRVVGGTIRQGRNLSAADTSTSQRVVVLNERATRDLGLGPEPVGQYILMGNTRLEVIGVAADIRQELEADPGPAMYVPAMQSRNFLSGQILIRTAGEPETVFPDIRTIVAAYDPAAVAYRMQTLEERLREARAPRRFLMQLVTTFSVLAIGLAVVGLAGVMAESVAQRVREIGIRMALGAQASAIVRMMVLRGLRIVAAGAAIGLLTAYQLRGTLEGFLFGIQPDDPWAYVMAAAVLIVAGATACYVPSRRAAAIDPVTALRTE
jgi:predicted permease